MLGTKQLVKKATSRRPYVYLCSRVAYDARPLNSTVANSLEEAGFEVYVPHEQAPNNLTQEDIDAGRFDRETIFQMDFTAMSKADLCVVVGRFGKDCAWELGWFAARGIPIYHVPAGDDSHENSPMLRHCLRQHAIINIPEMTGSVVKSFFEMFLESKEGR